MADLLKNLNVKTKALIVLAQKDDVVIKSAGNLPGLKQHL